METNRFKVGYVGYVPVFIDAMFILLAVLWFSQLMNAQTPFAVLIELVIALGLILSIVLHELGHSVMAEGFGVRTDMIELTGLGGLCYYRDPLPGGSWKRIAIFLAGPAVNLLIWYAMTLLQELPDVRTSTLEYGVASSLAWMNFAMFVFNLLPSYPLDGGRALEVLLTMVVRRATAIKLIGWTGMGIGLLCALYGVRSSSWWMLILAVSLFIANREQLRDVGAYKSHWP